MPPLHAALERVQTEAGDIHALRTGAPIEGSEDPQELEDVPLGNLRRAAALVELPQATMPEGPDHRPNVWCLSTAVNGREPEPAIFRLVARQAGRMAVPASVLDEV